jgi:hypothetical protein
MTNFVFDKSSQFPAAEQWKSFIHHEQAEVVRAVDRSARMTRNAAIAQGVGSLIMHAQMVKTVDNASLRMTKAVESARSSIEWGASITVEAISEMRRDNADLFRTTFSYLDATVESLGRATDAVDRVNESVKKLTALMDYRTQVMIDKLTITNNLLDDISTQLGIPDFQKERIYFFQQGLKHYRNARRHSELYRDALENLLKAEERETSDYLVLYYIGMIYLYGAGEIDPSAAERYFLRAAKYALGEARDSTTVVPKQLDIFNSDKKISAEEETNYRKRRARQIHVSALIEASIAAYAQEKFDIARDHAKEAVSRGRSDLRARLQYLKTLCAVRDFSSAHAQVRWLLDHALVMAIPISADDEILGADGVMDIFREYRDAASSRVALTLTNLLAEHEAKFESDQAFTSELEALRAEMADNTLLSIAGAEDRLSKLAAMLPSLVAKWQRQARDREKELSAHRKKLAEYEDLEANLYPGYPGSEKIREYAAFFRGAVANPESLDPETLGHAIGFLKTYPVIDFRLFRDLFEVQDRELDATMIVDAALQNLTALTSSTERLAWIGRVKFALDGAQQVLPHGEAVRLGQLLTKRMIEKRNALYASALEEIAIQDKKWLLKNYKKAVENLNLALRYGHPQAGEALKRCPNS